MAITSTPSGRGSGQLHRRGVALYPRGLPVIEIETHIAAPIERVFDLSRSVDLHVASTAQTREVAIAGVTSGLMAMGDQVTWQATHFAVRQRLTSQITAFSRPHHFRDAMVDGAFRRFDHDQYFESSDTGTCMRDVFDYASPLGVLGQLADALFLRRYVCRLLLKRNALVKSVAESDAWMSFLED